jgi:hypothetical protein
MAITEIEILQNFEKLPDDVLVSTKVTSLVINLSERSLRRDTSVIRKIAVSPGKFCFRVGDIRALVRGQNPAA